jgi:hypothetical protein
MTETPDRIERTLELLLYAPIGIGLFLKETAPQFVDMFVARGRAEIDRRQDDVQQRVTTARSLGQVALAFGPPMVRQRVERTVADAYHRAEGLFGSTTSDAVPPPRAAEPSPAPPTTEPTGSAGSTGSTGWSAATSPPRAAGDFASNGGPASNDLATTDLATTDLATNDLASSAGLPIPGYDALSASQVVERLMGLSRDELDAVHAYEASHRQRRTILGKIEQLAG